MNIVKNIKLMAVCLALLGTVQAESEYFLVDRNGRPKNHEGMITSSADSYPSNEACKKWCDDTSGCVLYSHWSAGTYQGYCELFDSKARLSFLNVESYAETYSKSTNP